jgi:hypothetical protein
LHADPHTFKTNLFTEVTTVSAAVSDKNKYYFVVTAGDVLLIIIDSNVPVIM